jgi:hypothetical protein
VNLYILGLALITWGKEEGPKANNPYVLNMEAIQNLFKSLKNPFSFSNRLIRRSCIDLCGFITSFLVWG